MHLQCLAFVLACLMQFVLTQSDSEFDELVKPISKKDLKRLKRLKNGEDPALYSGQFEGDMVLSSDQIEILYDDPQRRRQPRNGVRDKQYRWIDKTIPYRVAKNFRQENIQKIHDAAKKLGEVSCVKFITYDPKKHKDFVTINRPKPGCFSAVGRRGGEQFVNLGSPGCLNFYTIIHELLHTLGFYHMQSAPIRDEYVQIIYSEIATDHIDEFKKYKPINVTMFDVEYDYGSVMHFAADAFSIDDEDTIVPLKVVEDGIKLGQRDKLSEKDIQKLNSMYCETFWRDPEAETDEDIEDAEDYEDELEDDENDGYSDDEFEEDDYNDDDDYDDDDDDVKSTTTKNDKNDSELNASSNAEANIYDILAKLLDNIETLYNIVKGLFI